MNIFSNYFAKEKSEKTVEKLKLEIVQILFRHGKRTPITKLHFMEEEEPLNAEHGYEIPEWDIGARMYLTFPDEKHQFNFYEKVYERNKQYLKGTVNSGMLTKHGVEQLLEVGKTLRGIYVDKTKFLSPNLDPNEIYVRSTDFDRTLQSAMSLLNGLYPLEKRNGQILHILTRDRKTENIYSNYGYCKKLAQIGKGNKANPTYKEFLEKHRTELEMFKHIPKTKLTPENWHNTIQCHLLNKIPLPHYINEDFINLMEIRASEEVSHIFTKDASILGMGRLIGEMIDNFNRKIHNQDQRKIYLYSGHDTSIIPVLTALDIFDGKFPPVGTYLIFELYSDEQKKHYLRINYRDKDLQIPNLSYFEHEGKWVCSYDDFLKAIKDIPMTEKEFAKRCLIEEKEVSE